MTSPACKSAAFVGRKSEVLLQRRRVDRRARVKFSCKGAVSVAVRVLAVMTSVNVSSYILSQPAHFRNFYQVIILYIKSSDVH